MSQIYGSGELLLVLMLAFAEDMDIHLGLAYRRAMAVYARELCDGATSETYLTFRPHAFWATKPLGAGKEYEALCDELYEIAVASEGKAMPRFFAVFGRDILQPGRLAGDADVYDRLLIPLAKEGNTAGLEWASGRFAAEPEALDAQPDRQAMLKHELSDLAQSFYAADLSTPQRNVAAERLLVLLRGKTFDDMVGAAASLIAKALNERVIAAESKAFGRYSLYFDDPSRSGALLLHARDRQTTPESIRTTSNYLFSIVRDAPDSAVAAIAAPEDFTMLADVAPYLERCEASRTDGGRP